MQYRNVLAMPDRTVKVSFEDFWPGFCPWDFFIPFISSAIQADVQLTNSKVADVVFRSVFPKRSNLERVIGRLRAEFGHTPYPTNTAKKPGQKIVWFTGENQRPPLEGYDLTYSFDLDSYHGSNVYLPLIYLGLNWFGREDIENSLEGRRAGKVVTPAVASSPRDSDITSRSSFVCAFIGNPEPTRLRALAALEKIGIVDVYGDAVGRPVPNKFEIAKNYRFMLCFENDLYPGYVTEKALEAWVTGCIPLWRGIDQFGILNRKSLLNAFDYNSLEAFAVRVRELNNDRDKLNEIGSEPLFANLPSLQPAKLKLRHLLEEKFL